VAADPTTARSLPTGTVTFLRTDVEDSMGLIRALGQDWDAVNATHMGIIREAIDANGGVCVRTEGDAVFAAFPEARAAVAAAIAAQRTIATHTWPPGAAPRVRMGLHSGEAYLSGDDYGGLEVNRAARIAATGHGGQIVLSGPTQALVHGALADGVTIRDLGRHDLRSLALPERIHQLVVPGLRSEFPPLRTSGSPSGNLPERMSSFIGRDDELAALEALHAGHRLMTLTGPGGIGKTSLAIEHARRQAPTVPDGTWFVELDEIRDAGLVASAIARTLGLFDGAAGAAADALRPYLADRSVLLVLDNFEQVLDAAGEVATILRSSPGSRIVVTSRAPLRVAGEQEFPVGPLPTASRDDSSARLFAERARGVRPTFDPRTDGDAIQEVCTLLDGLPLGIELAAARVASLPVSVIRDRLAARLPLPGAGQRDAPDRQRTMDDAIGWSYALLPPDRQQVLRELSVFDGGFDLAQVQAVHGDDDVLETVVELVDQSLVARESDDAVELRFRLLKTIEAFALRQLRADEREDEVRRRHAKAFLDLVERIATDLPGPLQRGILQRLRLDHANVRGAVRWAIDHAEVEIALRLVGASWRYWQLDGHLVEGRALTDEALAMDGAEARSDARLRGVTAAGGIAYWQGRSDDAIRWYEEQLGLARELGNRAAEADASYNLIFRHFIKRDPAGAQMMLDEAVRLYSEIGDGRAIARIEWVRGTILMNQGRLAEATSIFEGALRQFREAGDAWYEALALGSLAWTRFNAGDVNGAVPFFLRSLLLDRALGDMATTAISLETAAIAALELGEPRVAATLLGALETATIQYGVQPPGGLALLLSTKAPRDRVRDELDEGTVERALEEGRRLSLDEAVDLTIEVATNAGAWPPGPATEPA
jgi:predicted ATPase/class 3 adenylate cyclase